MQRDQHRRSHADDRCPGMWTETASCETEPVATPARWKRTRTVSRMRSVPRYFFPCEAETARDTHLRVASSLATATIKRRLSYTRTRRTLWKLTGRSWTNPSRCRQELDPQIQEGTPRVETTRVLNAEAHVEYPLQIADERVAAMCNHRANQRVFKEMDYVKTNDQQWYGVMPDVCDVRKT